MVVLLAIAVLLSDNRKAINLRTVGGAFAIQFLFGAFVLYVPVGRDVLYGMSQGVANVIAYGNDGINFLFGGLISDKMFEVFGGGGFVFALRVLPVIVFFSALISVLYYLGVMQIVINVLGGGLRKVLGTSHAESMSATANIFVGQTEAPVVVRPFVPKMTQSELFAVMNVWWFGFCCWWCTSRLRIYGCTSRILNRSIIHGSTWWSSICENHQA
ncbi:putative nucleoside permease NupX [Photobacterium damselae subsp. piscicida]|uniref:Nucleoside permease NupX n=1 Tax=Photobacterium damsela subsp. piscicida TaxID=38294 RepID=A0AAD1CD72_PHODP|nr:Nucleoside permease NupX [Photobacterium damselae subsp. piscicida]BBC41047.1 putative nucleoside permease NupX [Photobacterium damselae subsp. piscicida]GAW44527.1 Nucleoside permease NupX [Photobacterium damselae subsp. piscicida]